MEAALRGWFANGYFRNVVSRDPSAFLPADFTAAAGTCVGGHFSRKKGRGLLQCHPQARQCLTFLRDPWEVSLSNYFYWKNKNRQFNIERGLLHPGDIRDYRNLDDYLSKTSSYILNFFPEAVTAGNYRDMIDKYFVFVGIVEDMQESADRVADILGRARIEIPRMNVSSRDEQPPEEARRAFAERHALEYEIYHYIRDNKLTTGI